MNGWIELGIAALGGGALTKLADLLLQRNTILYGTQGKLWRRIEALELRITHLESVIEQKEKENGLLEHENLRLQARCAQLETRVADLEKQLGISRLILPNDLQRGA